MSAEDIALGREMAAAAKAATEASMAAGYSRGDKVTKDSAKRAADEVYLRHRGSHDSKVPMTPPREPVHDEWQDRSDLD